MVIGRVAGQLFRAGIADTAARQHQAIGKNLAATKQLMPERL